jgi:putative ABC transport system permease protein
MEGVAVRSLRDALTRTVRTPLLLLLGSVAFLLLVACSNVVNLQLAQATSREGELAVRAALGAAPGRLRRQFLIESLLLSLSSGSLGVLAAIFGVRALIASAPADLPRLDDIAVNVPVLLMAFAIAIATGAILALITARRAATVDPRNGLISGGRGASGSQTSLRTGRFIVATQVALTLILLVGAGLLGRSLLQVLAVNPGFRVEQMVSMTIALPPVADERDAPRRVAFLDELLARLKRIPTVVDAGGTNAPPLSGGLADGTFIVLNGATPRPTPEVFEKYGKDPARSGDAEYCMTSAGYLRTLGIPLLSGRLFDEHDSLSTPHVALVNAALVRKMWPQSDPVGRVIEFGNMDGDLTPLTVLGVVGDVRNTDLETPAFPTIYVDYRQRPYRSDSFSVVLRTTAAPSSVIGAARQVLRGLDPTVPPSFDNFQRLFAASIARRRFVLMLVTLFGATALLLAIAGIYGVMGYSVARRTREMGVRMALGALPRDVIGLVVKQGLVATAAGLAAGLCGSLVLTRSLESLLYGVSAWDPMTFTAVALVLAAFGLAASYGPARRATRIDPQKALRSE